MELPEGVSKNATRSRSLDVGGRVNVETARAGVLGLIRTLGTVFVCKHPRNRKGGRDALNKAFLAALASINHPCAPDKRETPRNASRRGGDERLNPRKWNSKPDAKPHVHVTNPFRGLGTESRPGPAGHP